MQITAPLLETFLSTIYFATCLQAVISFQCIAFQVPTTLISFERLATCGKKVIYLLMFQLPPISALIANRDFAKRADSVFSCFWLKNNTQWKASVFCRDNLHIRWLSCAEKTHEAEIA